MLSFVVISRHCNNKNNPARDGFCHTSVWGFWLTVPWTTPAQVQTPTDQTSLFFFWHAQLRWTTQPLQVVVNEMKWKKKSKLATFPPYNKMRRYFLSIVVEEYMFWRMHWNVWKCLQLCCCSVRCQQRLQGFSKDAISDLYKVVFIKPLFIQVPVDTWNGPLVISQTRELNQTWRFSRDLIMSGCLFIFLPF